MTREVKAIVVGFSRDPRYFADNEVEVCLVVKADDVPGLRIDTAVTLGVPEVNVG